MHTAIDKSDASHQSWLKLIILGRRLAVQNVNSEMQTQNTASDSTATTTRKLLYWFDIWFCWLFSRIEKSLIITKHKIIDDKLITISLI